MRFGLMIQESPPVSVNQIVYCRGYNYQLKIACSIQLDLKHQPFWLFPLLSLSNTGLLVIGVGYAWGVGVQWPRACLRGSLVYDALRQAIDAGYLSKSHRSFAARTMVRICREDGLGHIAAWRLYRQLRKAGAVKSQTERELYKAP